MRYCPKCDTEYRDDVAACVEDGTALLGRKAYDAVRRKPLPMGRLTSLLTLADRFEAEELAGGLVEEGFDVALVSDKAQTLGTLTTAGPEIYSIVVPDTEAERARALLAEWRPGFEAARVEAEHTAEKEEKATEPA